MKESERTMRRLLLRPLVRQRHTATHKEKLIAALNRLDRHKLGSSSATELKAAVNAAILEIQKHNPNNFIDERSTIIYINIVRDIYKAGLMSTQEYIFHISVPIEHLHESRIFNNKYDDINLIFAALDGIHEEYGLGQDEYWPRGEGPDEYHKLNDEFDIAEKKRFIAIFREFDFHDIADLLEKYPIVYDRLRERGRRSVLHRDEHVYALKDIVICYEEEARKAAASKAYLAAVTSLGAGVEGLLLLRCLRSKRKAQRIAAELPKPRKPRNPKDPATWNFDTLIDICLKAGWLPLISTPIAKYNTAELADFLRKMRIMYILDDMFEKNLGLKRINAIILSQKRFTQCCYPSSAKHIKVYSHQNHLSDNYRKFFPAIFPLIMRINSASYWLTACRWHQH